MIEEAFLGNSDLYVIRFASVFELSARLTMDVLNDYQSSDQILKRLEDAGFESPSVFLSHARVTRNLSGEKNILGERSLSFLRKAEALNFQNKSEILLEKAITYNYMNRWADAIDTLLELREETDRIEVATDAFIDTQLIQIKARAAFQK